MKRKAWLLLVAVAVVLAACVVRRVSTPSAVSGGEVPQPAATVAPAPAPKAPPAGVTPSRVVRVPRPQRAAPVVVIEAGPVQPEEQSGDGAPKVEAIFADRGNQLCALVGDAVVSEGSVVHGYRVRKVQADGVMFEKDGQIWVQKLN